MFNLQFTAKTFYFLHKVPYRYLTIQGRSQNEGESGPGVETEHVCLRNTAKEALPVPYISNTRNGNTSNDNEVHKKSPEGGSATMDTA